MAIWEMTSLLIAPKKVFKSMYYHVSTLSSLGTRRTRLLTYYCDRNVMPPLSSIPNQRDTTNHRRNKKHLAPTRPFIHLPPFLLPPPNRPSLGPRLLSQLWIHIPSLDLVRVCPLYRHITVHFDNRILHCWPHIRPQRSSGEFDRFVARVEDAETWCCAGTVCAAR